MLTLFPPAVLAVVSNNAVPGDSAYPIKRGLEDVIYAVASLNPYIRALFAKARSDRRFQEISVLVTQRKATKETLNELVVQTQAAVNQIVKVSDPVQKEKLVNQLTDSIKKYDIGLAEISHQNISSEDSVFLITPQSTITSTTRPAALVSPIAQSQTPNPVNTAVPVSSSFPSTAPASIVPVPTSTPHPQSSEGNYDVEKARNELEKIKQQLEQQRQSQNQARVDQRKNDQGNNQDEKDKKDKQEKDSGHSLKDRNRR